MKTVVKMIVTLSLIGIISGGFLSYIAAWAAPKIEKHRKEATAKAIFLVQPEGKKYESVEKIDFECYKVLGENDQLLGFALPYEGNGFQGKIRLMIGIKDDLKEMTGLQVLEQVETPGLGTRVTEEDYLKQFVGLITEPRIDWVKGAAPDKSNEIQAITGATISSKAVVLIVNDGIKKLRSIKDSGGKL
ncbi:MAG: electron transporter RnfG [Ignavibacteriae bacterium HGW-Ignavibacteriae-2]|jgi:electron transport complex protein RnfG|nr:MAG: electron transporter RnfG [Ignavibacteriae bacterium HGW-Ignavibacteriae-2]